MTALLMFPTVDLQGDHSQEWKKYESRFKNLTLIMNITNAAWKKAILLQYMGEVNKIFDTDVEQADQN